MKGRNEYTFIGPAHINAAVKQSEVLLRIEQSLGACYLIAVSLEYLNKYKKKRESDKCEFS